MVDNGGIPDWPGFEPRGGRHSVAPSFWVGPLAGSGGEFMDRSIGLVHGRGGLVGVRMDPDSPGTCVCYLSFKKNYHVKKIHPLRHGVPHT